jgi:multiple sugar transport system substrate-binding protein
LRITITPIGRQISIRIELLSVRGIFLNARTLLQLALAGLIAGLVLSACTPAATPEPAVDTPIPTATRTAAPSPTAAPPEPTPQPTPTRLPHLQLRPEDLQDTRISFWHPWSGELATIVSDSAAEFNRVNAWGIQVDVVAPGGSGLLFEQIMERLTGSDPPNVVAGSMDQILTWQQLEGVVINLNDYVDDPVWGLNAQERADFPRAFWDDGESGGRRYGIPAMRSPEMLFYNVTWGRELGFATPPGTMDQFEEQACAAAAANRADSDPSNDGTGGYIVSTDPLVQLSWMYSFGFNGFEAGESIRFNRGPTRQMFTFFRHLYDRSCVWRARLEPYEYFATRRALFYSGSLYDVPVQEFIDQRFGNEDEWMVLPYPPPANGAPVVLTSGLSYAVLASEAEEQLAAWLFIRWMSTSRVQAPLAAASGAWPASVNAIEQLEGYRGNHPAWEGSLMWMPVAKPAPLHPEWRVVRSVLSDATWQLYQANIKLEDIPNLLSILDATVADVLENQ